MWKAVTLFVVALLVMQGCTANVVRATPVACTLAGDRAKLKVVTHTINVVMAQHTPPGEDKDWTKLDEVGFERTFRQVVRNDGRLSRDEWLGALEVFEAVGVMDTTAEALLRQLGFRGDALAVASRRQAAAWWRTLRVLCGFGEEAQ